jgi:hypothetical protein
MGLLDVLKFRVATNAGAVTDLIKKWKPENCKSEKDFEKSLYEFLHVELGDGIQITKQFARGRMKADIVVDDKVIIELKFKLDTTAKYQRLIGQLETYRGWEGSIIVLLTEKTEPNLRKELIKKIDELNNREFNPLFLVTDDQFRLVEK